MSDWFNAAGWPGESVISCSEDRNFDDGTHNRTQPVSTAIKSRLIPPRQCKRPTAEYPEYRDAGHGPRHSSIPGTFVYTPPAGTVEPVGTDTLSVTFTPNDTTDYKPASATVKLWSTHRSRPSSLPRSPGQLRRPSLRHASEYGTTRRGRYGNSKTHARLSLPASCRCFRPLPTAPTITLAALMGLGNTYSYNLLSNGSVNYAGTTFTLGPAHRSQRPYQWSSLYAHDAGELFHCVPDWRGERDRADQSTLYAYLSGCQRRSDRTVSMSSWNAPAGYAGESVVASTGLCQQPGWRADSGNL